MHLPCWRRRLSHVQAAMALYSHHTRQRANPVGRRHAVVSAFIWRFDDRLSYIQLYRWSSETGHSHLCIHSLHPSALWELAACAIQAIPSGQFQMLWGWSGPEKLYSCVSQGYIRQFQPLKCFSVWGKLGDSRRIVRETNWEGMQLARPWHFHDGHRGWRDGLGLYQEH